MAAREGAVNARRAGLCQLRDLLITTPELRGGSARHHFNRLFSGVGDLILGCFAGDSPFSDITPATRSGCPEARLCVRLCVRGHTQGMAGDKRLSEKQKRVIVAVLGTGGSRNQAAKRAGCSHTSVSRWLARDPEAGPAVERTKKAVARRERKRAHKAQAGLGTSTRRQRDSRPGAEASTQPGPGIHAEQRRAPDQAAVGSDPLPEPAASAGSSWSGGPRRRGDGGGRIHSSRQGEASSAYAAWLSTPKNLSAEAAGALQLAADGYVYAVAPDGSDRGWHPAGRVPAGHLISDP
jgi:hypothetical protein